MFLENSAKNLLLSSQYSVYSPASEDRRPKGSACIVVQALSLERQFLIGSGDLAEVLRIRS